MHGWITGDVAYFPNDVSVYALIELVHGYLLADMGAPVVRAAG